MEPSQSKPIDESTLSAFVADFNAITQNQDQTVAAHYLEMSNYDLNVFFKFLEKALFFKKNRKLSLCLWKILRISHSQVPNNNRARFVLFII